MRIFTLSVLCIVLAGSFVFGQSDEIDDQTLLSILAERDKVKTEMEAAKEAQDLDKYNELKTVFDDLNAKAEARKEFVLNEKKEAKRLLDDGSKYRRDKRWDKAEQSYAGALGKSDFIDQSIIPSIHLLIGFCQEQQKKYDSALVSYKTVTELDPKKAEAFEGMGRVYSKMNMKTESINAYKKAIELDPENAKAYFGLATGYYNVNMREDAEKYYAIAVEKDSTYDKAYYQLGVVRFKLRKYSEAVAALKKATEINKRYYLAFTFMAQIYNTTGDYAAAIDAAESSINIKSNYAQSHFEKGIALYHTERYNQALESFKKCLNDRTWREQAEYHIKLINDKTANQGLKNSEQ